MLPNQTPTHIAGLDGLRALAALAVFGVHFNQTVRFDTTLGPFDVARLLENGEYGVSLFFSLSGFLLSLPFWRRLNAAHALPGFRVYAVRRLARILPAYYGALTVLIVLGGLWRYPAAYTDIVLHYTFLFNFTEFSIFSINAPFWTLAVEVQFYLLLPLIFILLARLGRGWRLWLLAALCLGTYALHYFLMGSVRHIIEWPFAPWLVWVRPYGAVLSHSLLAHLPHFLFGIMAGCLFLNLSTAANGADTRREWISEMAFWCALGVLLILLSTPLGNFIQLPYGRYGLPLAPLLLVTLIVSAPGSRYARLCLASFPLRGLGIISYGIYIYHLPCMTLADRYLGQYGLDASERWILFGVISLALTLTAATASYGLLERPVLRYIKQRARPSQ